MNKNKLLLAFFLNLYKLLGHQLSQVFKNYYYNFFLRILGLEHDMWLEVGTQAMANTLTYMACAYGFTNTMGNNTE